MVAFFLYVFLQNMRYIVVSPCEKGIERSAHRMKSRTRHRGTIKVVREAKNKTFRPEKVQE